MFYSNFILVKKGPLAKVWLAAHLHRRLNKTQITETDINISANSIKNPTVQLALRLSGQLLLGLVRIYSRKVEYLAEDCNDAMTKMKVVNRAGAVDLQPEQVGARLTDINLPEGEVDDLMMMDNLEDLVFDDMNLQAEDFNSDQRLSLTSVARHDDLTPNDVNFDDVNFDMNEMLNLEEGAINDSMGGDLDFVTFDDEPATPAQDSKEKSSDSIEIGRDREPSPAFAPSPAIGGLADQSNISMGAVEDSSMDISFVNFDDTGPLPEMPDDQSVAVSVAASVGTSVAGSDEPAVEEEEEEEIVVAPKRKRQKKKRKIPRDTTTELTSAFIKKGLQDVSDIVLSKRPNLYKRARLEDPDALEYALQLDDTDLSSTERMNLFDAKLTSGPIDPVFRDWSLLAPELLDSMRSCFDQHDDVEEQDAEEEVPLEAEELEQDSKQDQEVPVEEAVFEPEVDAFNPDDVLHNPDALLDQDFAVQDNMSFDQSVDISLDNVDNSFSAGDQSLDMSGEIEQPLQERDSVLFADLPDEVDSAEVGEEKLGGYSKRTRTVHQMLMKRISKKKKDASTSLHTMLDGATKKDAAVLFYEMLVLRTHSYINTEQDTPYDDITITPGQNFRTLVRV
jgi:cohesin complex subunit SCC1